MAYAGICFPTGGCIVIIAAPFIKSIFERILGGFLALAQNLEFIGVALGVSILLYVELEIHSLNPDLTTSKKKGLHTVNDFFLLSSSMFLLSAIIEWINSQQEFPPFLYNNPILSFLEAAVFVIGLFTLAVGVGVLREIGRTGRSKMELPSFGILVAISVWVLLNFIIFVYSVAVWNSIEWPGHVFDILVALTTPIAVVMTITAWGKNWRRVTLAVILLFIPWAFIITAVLVTAKLLVI